MKLSSSLFDFSETWNKCVFVFVCEPIKFGLESPVLVLYSQFFILLREFL